MKCHECEKNLSEKEQLYCEKYNNNYMLCYNCQQKMKSQDNAQKPKEETNDKVKNFKSVDADKFTLGMSINAMADIFKLNQLDECNKEIYKKKVKLLYKWNKELREEILGY